MLIFSEVHCNWPVYKCILLIYFTNKFKGQTARGKITSKTSYFEIFLLHFVLCVTVCCSFELNMFAIGAQSWFNTCLRRINTSLIVWSWSLSDSQKCHSVSRQWPTQNRRSSRSAAMLISRGLLTHYFARLSRRFQKRTASDRSTRQKRRQTDFGPE